MMGYVVRTSVEDWDDEVIQLGMMGCRDINCEAWWYVTIYSKCHILIKLILTTCI